MKGKGFKDRRSSWKMHRANTEATVAHVVKMLDEYEELKYHDLRVHHHDIAEDATVFHRSRQ